MKGNCWMGCGKDFEVTKDHQNNNWCPDCYNKSDPKSLNVMCQKCNTLNQYEIGESEPDKFGNRCIVCIKCRAFIRVNEG
jgi:hypothetical protein